MIQQKIPRKRWEIRGFIAAATLADGTGRECAGTKGRKGAELEAEGEEEEEDGAYQEGGTEEDRGASRRRRGS